MKISTTLMESTAKKYLSTTSTAMISKIKIIIKMVSTAKKMSAAVMMSTTLTVSTAMKNSTILKTIRRKMPTTLMVSTMKMSMTTVRSGDSEDSLFTKMKPI